MRCTGCAVSAPARRRLDHVDIGLLHRLRERLRIAGRWHGLRSRAGRIRADRRDGVNPTPGAPFWGQTDEMRVESRAVGAIFTVLLHLPILFALLRATTGAEKPPQPAEQEMTADRLHGAGERIIGVDIRPGLSTNGLACAGSSYIGIGVTATPGSERIILVGEDTPASRAGLQRDDIVLNPDVWRDAHKEGALLRVVVLREGVKMVVSVLVGKICIG